MNWISFLINSGILTIVGTSIIIVICVAVLITLFRWGANNSDLRADEDSLSDSDKEELRKLREQQQRDRELFRTDDIGTLRRYQAIQSFGQKVKEAKAEHDSLSPDERQNREMAMEALFKTIAPKFYANLKEKVESQKPKEGSSPYNPRDPENWI